MSWGGEAGFANVAHLSYKLPFAPPIYYRRRTPWNSGHKMKQSPLKARIDSLEAELSKLFKVRAALTVRN